MKLPKPVSFLLRAGVTVAACYLAFSQVDLAQMLPLLARLPLWVVVTMLALLHGGQVVSALRTRLYLHFEQIDFPIVPSLKLHYVGGLFNAFLPGGTGGDIYKAWWLKHHTQGRMFSMVKLMIRGRLNGLWALGAIVCVLALGSAKLNGLLPWFDAMVLAALLGGTLCYALLARLVLGESYQQQRRAASYSLLLQFMLAAAAWVVCIGLGVQDHALEYVILFMLSCLLAMLPISIGGIGVRELVLLHGSALLNLSPESGVALAFSFSLLGLTVPLIGAIVLHFFAPERHEGQALS
jgi:uncharacterized membrane protein YbhN (UPF0104 family)